MDMLFIIFIIYLIFSIISRAARAVQKGLPQPASPPRPPQPEESVLQEILDRWEEAHKEGDTAHPYFELPQQPEGRYPVQGYPEQPPVVQQPSVARTIVVTSGKRPLQKVPSLPAQAPRSREAIRPAVPKKAPAGTAAASGLEQLLDRENLPRAVIAAEVLAAPRCKRPLLRRGI